MTFFRPTAHRAVPRWAVIALALPCLGACIASHRGLVESEGGAGGPLEQVTLCTPEGREFTLRSAEEMDILRALDGCTLDVSGPVVAGSMVVRDWRVLDAGDGSAPYLGLLRQHGSNLVIDDRNSGMPLVLDEPSAARLGQHTGGVVMISGYVIGAQLLHVVTFRILVD